MSDDLATKVAAIEAMRAVIGDAAVAAALANIYAEHGVAPPPAPAVAPPPAPEPARPGQHLSATNSTVKHVKMITAGVFVEAPKNPAEQAAQEALARYLHKVSGICSTLKLGALDTSDAVTAQGVQLAQVYISLDTTTRPEMAPDKAREQSPLNALGQERDQPPLSALAAVQQARCTLLLGAPGYGKSTFVDHLTSSLARIALHDTPAAALSAWPDWSAGLVLPVRVVLRDWAAALNFQAQPKGGAALLRDFLDLHLSEWRCAEAAPLLWQMIHDGRAMLLLDGFDEVVGAGLPLIAASIADLRAVCPDTRILVTCRELDYREEPQRQLPGFALHTLAELTDEQIANFVRAWYVEHARNRSQIPADAAKKAERLITTVNQRGELQPLARSPLLLTVMAIVHASRGVLPDSRALLYKECIEILLLRWRQTDQARVDLLDELALPNVGRKELFDLMARLGFVAHDAALRDQQSRGPADLAKMQVLETLTEGLRPFVASEEQRDKAALTILYALARGNGVLLQRSAKVYAFPHRTFQEFLAGYHIANQSNRKQLVRERASQIHWHEALLLMVSFRVMENNDTEFPVEVVAELLQRDPLARILAGEMLLSIGRGRLEQYFASEAGEAARRWEAAAAQLVALATTSDSASVPAAQRARAGAAHGALSFGPLETLAVSAPALLVPDPRLPLAYLNTPHQQADWWQPALDAYWCHCAAGPFWFGDDLNGDLQQITLPDDFRIGRYPVTNAEYARFVAAGGYADARWWTPQGWAFVQPGGHPWDDQAVWLTQSRFWDDAQFNQPTQPVVGISWYEAAAYAAWVSAEVGAVVRLPTSLEWERAARGGDQRCYPWGADDPTPEHANYDATNLGQPSPIGCFPHGVGPNGASDLKGNAMEWLATARGDDENPVPLADCAPNQLVLLVDGAYWRSTDVLHCGARLGFNPNDWFSSGGFRLVFPSRR